MCYGRKSYYFKHLDDANELLQHKNSLAHNNGQYLAEIVDAKVVRQFGIEAPNYQLAELDGVKGVVSKDFNMTHGKVERISDYIDICDISLQQIKDLEEYASFPAKTKKELELASYLSVGIGNEDCHSGNIAVYHNRKDNGVILYDFSFSYPAEIMDKKHRSATRDYTQSFRNNITEYGIENKSRGQYLYYNYFNDLNYSQYVDTNVLREYVTKLKDLLNHDACMTEVRAEIKDEYGVYPSSKFTDLVRFTLETTGEYFEDALQQRERYFGE